MVMSFMPFSFSDLSKTFEIVIGIIFQVSILDDDKAIELIELMYVGMAQFIDLYISPTGGAFNEGYAHWEAVTVGGQTKFACVDGPEFDGHKVNFEQMMKRMDAYKTLEQKAFEDHKCKIGLQ